VVTSVCNTTANRGSQEEGDGMLVGWEFQLQSYHEAFLGVNCVKDCILSHWKLSAINNLFNNYTCTKRLHVNYISKKRNFILKAQ
jgi:hypothetical protein